MESEVYAGGTLGSQTVNYTYDPALLLRTNISLSGVAETQVGYQYDGASRLTNIVRGDFAVGYGYVENSRLIGSTVSRYQGNERLAVRQYDLVNRLTEIHSTPSDAQQLPWGYRYGYNQANQRTSVTLADKSKWDYGYDELGQVTSGKKYWNGSTPVAGQQFEYAYDQIGNRLVSARGGDHTGANLRETIYTANDLNQYAERTVPEYVDVVGIAPANKTVRVEGSSTGVIRQGEYYRKEISEPNTSSAQYPEINVDITDGVTTNPEIAGNIFIPKTPEVYQHDADGNLTQDGRWSYTWDAENRLVKQESLSGAPTGSAFKLEFKYDSRGRRIYKKVTDLGISTVVKERKFIYDGWNLYAELSGSGSLVQSYIWGTDLSGSREGAGGVGGLVGVKPAGQAVHFVANDGNGNVIGLVDGSNCSISARYEYGPFAESIRVTGKMGEVNPFRFSTKYTDEESDLLYYGYRYYDSVTGRWMSRDPFAELGGRNLYGFAANSPLNHVDRFGLDVAATVPTSTTTGSGLGIDTEEAAQKIKDFGKEVKRAPKSSFIRCCTSANAVGLALSTTVSLNGGEAEWLRQRDRLSQIMKECGRLPGDLDECLDKCDAQGLVGTQLNECYCSCWDQFPSTPRKKKKHELKKEWKENTGQPWPVDPTSGIDLTPHHIWPLADGGPDSGENIDPMLPEHHLEYHKNTGDSSRWGRRKGRTCK